MKPLSQRLHDQRNGAGGFPTDAALLGRALGVYAPGEPLPESITPIRHLEDEDNDRPHVLRSNRPKRAEHSSLTSIVTGRLISYQQIANPARKAELEGLVQTLAVKLMEADQLLKDVEDERFSRIDDQWEELRIQGRRLIDVDRPQLESELGERQRYANEAEERKQRRALDARQCYEERRRLSIWDSKQEIKEAEDKFTRAVIRSEEATARALLRQQQLAETESKLATLNANLEAIEMEMDRLSAEADGEEYHAERFLGLAINPTTYRDTQ